MTDEVAVQTITITVDGKPMEGRPGEMLIAAAERGGVYIPRFCWHPRMKPVGMCRMCLVEIEGPRGFALMPACYVPVKDGQQVVTTSEKVKKAQDGVLEFLLINHPLDCPVCDRGGECPLQDQTFTFGPGESRFVEEKRHWAKPIPINSLVNLDRERCIQCARCTRFAEEVAGDPFIDLVGRSDVTEINTFPGGSFDSNFSGNVVQICPVGALTSTPYRFKARPWDLAVVESTCTFCAVGCRMALQSSSDRLIRHLGLDSEPVNHGWLCDKGRYGYESNYHEGRLTTPMVRRNGTLVEASWAEALGAAAQGLATIRDIHGPASLAVLGGSRLPNEDAYAWAKLAKSVLGTDNVDCQMGDGLPADVVLGLPRATIDEACAAPVVVLLAGDLKEELPILYLRLREAAIDGGTALIEISPQSTGLSPQAAVSLLHRPGEAGSVARALLASTDEGRSRKSRDPIGGVDAADIARAAELLHQDGVVVVLGRSSLAEGPAATVDAAGVLSQLAGVRFLSGLRRSNVHGALDMGLAPGVLPGRTTLNDGWSWFHSAWGAVPEQIGLDAHQMLEAAAESRVQGLVLLGADPLADFPDRTLARRALSGVGFTLALDLFVTGSHENADVVLPVTGYGERSGTTTNIEGRVSPLDQKVTAPSGCRPDWMIAAELALRLGADLGFDSAEGIAAEILRVVPTHARLTPELLSSAGGRDGVVVPLNGDRPPAPPVADEIEVSASLSQGETGPDEPATDPSAEPRPAPSDLGEVPAPLVFRPPEQAWSPPPVHAYSVRLVSSRRLYDQGTLVQHCPSLAPLAPEGRLRVNHHELDRLGVAGGEQVRVTSPRGSLTLAAVADAGIPRGSGAIDFNQSGPGSAELIDASEPVTEIRVESIASVEGHQG